MSRLKLRLFGSYEAILDGQPLNGFRSNKARALLAYLVVEANRVHLRESLGTLLWGSYSQEAARLSLRVALSNLRQILAPLGAPSNSQTPTSSPFLTVTRQTVEIDVDWPGCWVDLAEFDALWAACERDLHKDLTGCPACVQRMDRLVELYRGDLLEGSMLPDCPGLDEWRLLQQEAYHRRALTALQILTNSYADQKRYEQAEHYARRQIALEPWREGAHRHLMRILAASGQRGAALAQYKTCQQILAEELGTEPADETTTLYRQLCNGAGKDDAALQSIRPTTPRSSPPCPPSAYR